MQNAEEELVSHGKDSINLAAWERSVKEESNLDVLLCVPDLFSQHLWEQHQMVVVNPN
jgi:hypothetical protein